MARARGIVSFCGGRITLTIETFQSRVYGSKSTSFSFINDNKWDFHFCRSARFQVCLFHGNLNCTRQVNFHRIDLIGTLSINRVPFIVAEANKRIELQHILLCSFKLSLSRRSM